MVTNSKKQITLLEGILRVFTFGCSVTSEEYFNPSWHLRSRCIKYLFPKRNSIHKIESASLQATTTSAHWLIVLNIMPLVFIIHPLHKCHGYVWFHLTAQNESILLSTSKEEQPEDRSQPPKVGIRLENSWNYLRPGHFQKSLMENNKWLFKIQRENSLKD